MEFLSEGYIKLPQYHRGSSWTQKYNVLVRTGLFHGTDWSFPVALTLGAEFPLSHY